MSKRTKSIEYRIKKFTENIEYLKQRLKLVTDQKRKHKIKFEICCKRRTLRHLSKLYIWGVK